MAEREKEAVALSIKLFYEIRAPRIKAIAEKERNMDRQKTKMSVLEAYGMYCFFLVDDAFTSVE